MGSQKTKYDAILLDLDDTLYPLSTGIQPLVNKNIPEFIINKVGVPESKMAELRSLLYKTYGTTIAGLVAIGYDLDFDDYHGFIHGRLPYDIIKPDPALKTLLQSIPIKKFIFTNADKAHATKVLARLGLEEDIFDGIICFEALNPNLKSKGTSEIVDIVGHVNQGKPTSELPKPVVVTKPLKIAFEEAIKIANVDPQRALFLDDSGRNIKAGKEAGLVTALVGKSEKIEGADYAFESIHNLKEAIPEIWAERA